MYVFPRQQAPEASSEALSTANARALFATTIAFPLLAMTMILARFYSRLIRKTSLWLDDWLVVFTLLMIIGQSIANMTGMRNLPR